MSEDGVERVNVTVDEAHLAELPALVSKLEAAGLRVTQVLSTVGIVTGEIVSSKREQIKGVAGVLEVEQDAEMHAIGDGG
jgi:methylmalonyl-CoA mutase cobalamin-binding subunit